MMLWLLGLPLVASLEVIGDIPTLTEGRNSKQNMVVIRTAKLNRKKTHVAARKMSSNSVGKVGGRCAEARSMNNSRKKNRRDELGQETKKCCCEQLAADDPSQTCSQSALQLTSSHSGESFSHPDDSSPHPQLCAAELTLNSQKVTLKSPIITPSRDSSFVCIRCGQESAWTDNNIQLQNIAMRQYSPLEQNDKDGDACLARTIEKQCMASAEWQTTPTPMNKATITSHSYNTRMIHDENLFVHASRTLINDQTRGEADDENIDFLSEVVENTTILPERPTQQRESKVVNSEPNHPSCCNDQLGSGTTLGEVGEDKSIIVSQRSQINVNNSHSGSESGTVSEQDDENINIPRSKRGSVGPSPANTKKRSSEQRSPQNQENDEPRDDERNDILPSKRGSAQQSAVEVSQTYSKRSSVVGDKQIDDQYALDARQEDEERINIARSRQGSARVSDVNINPIPSKRSSEQRSTQPSGVNINQIHSKRSSEQRSPQSSGVNINQIPSKRSSEQRSTQPSGVNINQIPSKRSSEQRSTQPSGVNINQIPSKRSSEQRSPQSSGVNINQIPSKRSSEQRSPQSSGVNINQIPSKRSSEQRSIQPSGVNINQIPSKRSSEQRSPQSSGVNINQIPSKRSSEQRSIQPSEVNINQIPSKRSSEQRSIQPSGVNINQIPSKRSSEQRSPHSSGVNISQASNRSLSEQRSTQPSASKVNEAPSRRSSFVPNQEDDELRDERIDAYDDDDEGNNILPSKRGSVQPSLVEDSQTYSKRSSVVEDVTVNQVPSRRSSEQRSRQPTAVNSNQITSRRSSEQRSSQNQENDEPRDDERNDILPSKRGSAQQSAVEVSQTYSKRSSVVGDKQIDDQYAIDARQEDEERINIARSRQGSARVSDVNIHPIPSKRSSEQRSTQPSGVNINQIHSKRSSEQRSPQSSGVNINQIPSKRSSEQRSTQPSSHIINQAPSRRSSEQKSRPPSLNNMNRIPSKRSSFVEDQETDDQQEERIEADHDDDFRNEMKPTSKVQQEAYVAAANHQTESRFDHNQFQIPTNWPDRQPKTEINQREVNSDTHLDVDPSYRPNIYGYKEKQKPPFFAYDTAKEVIEVGATSRSCDPCETKRYFALVPQGTIKCEKRQCEFARTHRGTCSDDESQSVCRKKCLLVCPETCKISTHRTQRQQDYEDSKCRSKSANHYDDRSGSLEKKTCMSSGCEKRVLGCVLGSPGRVCIGTIKRQCGCASTREEHENLQSPSRQFKRKQENLKSNDKHNMDYGEDMTENLVYPVGSARKTQDRNHNIKQANYEANENDPISREVNFQELKDRAPRSPPKTESFVNIEGREQLQAEMAPSKKGTVSQERPATETSAARRPKDNECCRAVIICRCNDGFHDQDTGCYIGKIKHIQSSGPKACIGLEERAFPSRNQTSYAESDECEYYMTLNSELTGSGAEEFRDAIEESYKDCATDFSADARKNYKDCMEYSSAKQYAASGSQPRRPIAKEGTPTCYLAPLCRDVRDVMCDARQDFTVQLNDVSDEDCEQRAMDLKRQIYRKITVDPRDIIEFRKMCRIPIEGIDNDEDVDFGHSEPQENSRGKTDPELDNEERIYDNNETKESYNSPIDQRVNKDIENNVDDTDISKETEASSDFNNEYNDHQEVAQIDETSRVGTPELETNKDEAVSAPFTGSSRPVKQDDADDEDITEIRGQEEVAYDDNDDSQSINDSIVHEDDMSEPIVTESNARTETVSNRTSSQIPDIEYENKISPSSRVLAEKAQIAEKVKSVSSVQKTAASSAVQSPSPSKVTSTDKATNLENTSLTETAHSTVQSPSPSKVTSMEKATSQERASFIEKVNTAVQSPIPSKVTSMEKATSQERASFIEKVNTAVQSPIPSKVTSMEEATSQERASFIEKVNTAVQSPSPSKVTSMEEATSQERASFIEKVNTAVQSPSPSKVTSMEKATSQDKAIFEEAAYSAARTPSQSKARTMENSATQTPSPSKARSMDHATSTIDAGSPHKILSAKRVGMLCRDDNPELYYTEIGQTLYDLLSKVDPRNVTEDESAESLTHAIDFLNDLIQSDLCLTRENYNETGEVGGGSAQFKPNNLSSTVSNCDIIDKFKSLIESYYNSIGDNCTIVRENNKVIRFDEEGSTEFDFYALLENKGVTEQTLSANVVSRYDVACDVAEDFKQLLDEMDVHRKSVSEVGPGNVRIASRRTSKRDFASSVLEDFQEEIMQRVLTTACQTEQTYSEANEETEPDTQDHISVSSKHSSFMSHSRVSRTNSRDVGHKSSTDHQRRQSLLNEDLYDQDVRESLSNVAKTKSDSVTGDDVESQYIGEMEKNMDEDSGPDEMAHLSMQEEIPLSNNDLRKFPADESTEDLSVANVGALRSVSLHEEEMFNESAHHRPGKRSNRQSEVEIRSSATSSPVRERKCQNRSRSDEERNRYVKDKVDSRRSRTTPEYRDNGYKEHCSNKYQDERGSNRHSANEDQRRRVIHSDSQDWQHARPRNERQQQRPNSDTYVKKRITTPTGQDDRLAYRQGENCRGTCSRDETPQSSSPVFYDANSTSGSSKCKVLSRPVSSGEESDDDAEQVSRSPYDEDSRGRSSGSGYQRSSNSQNKPKQHTSDRNVGSKPQNYTEDTQRYCMERRKCQTACEAKCNREFFRSKTIIPPWQTRGPANISSCYGQMEDPSHLADRLGYSSRKYEHNAARPMDYQQKVDCVGSSPNNYDAVGPSSINNCFARTGMPTCPPTDYLGCFQNKTQQSYLQPQGNCVYPNYETPVSYNNQPFAMPSVYGNQPVAMPYNCVNQPVAPPLFNNCPKVDIPSQTCPPMQMAGFYKDNCQDGNSWNENYISQGGVPAPAYSQERRVPRAWFKQTQNDDSDNT